MKTKNVVVTALVAMCFAVSAFANEPVNSKLVVVNQKSGVFKVIYEGTKAGKVSMKITDKSGNQLFAETIRSISGFIRPVNFDGMAPGAYTIAITDENGTLIQTVNYLNEKVIKNVYISKTAEAGKYLLSVANKGTEVINVRIYDGENNLVHDENVTVKGYFGIVYNLKKIVGTPTFEITDEGGNDLVSK